MNAKCQSVRCNVPVQQKENSKNHAGNAIGGHKCKIHAAKVIWFYKQVLINEHDAEKCNSNVIKDAYMCKKCGHNYKSRRKHV